MGQTEDQNQEQPGGSPQGAATAETEEQEELSLWAELEDAERAATGDEPLGDQPGGEDPGAVREAPTDAEVAAAGEEAGEQQTDDDDTESAGDQGEQQRADPPDPFANATPEQKAAWKAAQEQLELLTKKDRDQRNRISALQRKYEGQPARAAERRSNGDAGKGAEPADSTVDVLFESDEWKTHAREYPEIAGPTRKVIEALESKITTQGKELAAIGHDRREAAFEEQQKLLLDAHPDYESVTHTEEFDTWLFDQPRYVVDAALRNAEKIVDAEEAADLVSRFKAFRSAEGGGQAPADAQPDNGQGNGTTRLSGKRQRQLESAAGARSRTPGPASGIPADGDEEQLWKQFDRMEARQGQRA